MGSVQQLVIVIIVGLFPIIFNQLSEQRALWLPENEARHPASVVAQELDPDVRVDGEKEGLVFHVEPGRRLSGGPDDQVIILVVHVQGIIRGDLVAADVIPIDRRVEPEKGPFLGLEIRPFVGVRNGPEDLIGNEESVVAVRHDHGALAFVWINDERTGVAPRPAFEVEADVGPSPVDGEAEAPVSCLGREHGPGQARGEDLDLFSRRRLEDSGRERDEVRRSRPETAGRGGRIGKPFSLDRTPVPAVPRGRVELHRFEQGHIERAVFHPEWPQNHLVRQGGESLGCRFFEKCLEDGEAGVRSPGIEGRNRGRVTAAGSRGFPATEQVRQTRGLSALWISGQAQRRETVGLCQNLPERDFARRRETGSRGEPFVK